MRWLALFNPIGHLEKRPFAIAVVGVLLLSAASLGLLAEPGLAQAKLLPFAFMQAVLHWVWFSLHVNRLRDADFGAVMAVGLSIIGCFMMGLFVIAAIEFVVGVPHSGGTENPFASDIVEVIRAILEELFDYSEEESARTALVAVPHVPWIRFALAALLTLGFSIWAGWLRSAATQS